MGRILPMNMGKCIAARAALLTLLASAIWIACGSDDPATPDEKPPVCTVRSDTVDFGPVTIGGAVERTIEIENTGEGTLTGTISVSTSVPCDGFSIISGGGDYSLGPNHIYSIRVRFEPASLGNKTCRLNTGNTLCGAIELLGRAEVDTDCEVQPASIDFGAVSVGTTRDTTFTITNTGGGFLTGNVLESCPEVTILLGGGNYSLGSGESRVVSIRFRPSEGANSCTIETGNALCNDVEVTGATDFPDFVATVVGESGTILRTNDGGLTWVPQTSGTSGILIGVDFTDINTGTAVGQNGTILRTIDGGVTWNPQTSGVSDWLSAVTFTDANTGTVVGNIGIILRTTDGGANWTPQVSDTSEHLSAVAFSDVNTGMIVGWNGLILWTTNGGADWDIVDAGTNRYLTDGWLADATNGIIVSGRNTATGFVNSQILRTGNGGGSWSIQEPLPDVYFNAMSFIDINTGSVVGAFGEIYRTEDGGTTWMPQSSGVTNLNDVVLLDANVGVAVGYLGKILETFDGGTSWVGRPSGTTRTLRGISLIGF